MTKTIPMILVTLLSVACGGAPFGTDASFGPDASDAGAPSDVAGATAAGSGSVAGSGAGGSSAGAGGGSVGDAGRASGGSKATGGTGATGGGGATGTAGAPPMACALDQDALAAALPSIITWTKWSSKTASACVTCTDNKCFENTNVTWTAPVMDVPGTLSYGMVGGGSVHVGIGDKTCAVKSTCGVEMLSLQLDVHVTQQSDGWVVSATEPHVFFGDNMCLETAASEHDLGDVTQAMNSGFEQDLGTPLVGLKIPCK
jgi:hypothetical protein